ncbi:hypothetical protein [Streptomyces sp. KR80]|uniref:hypothetical protein n=1 Tax=Streptomyces sp. KR80 TaxID=3457426 RepID=UPI003FCF2960
MILPTTDHPDFYTQLLTLREPAWREPTEDELIALEDDIFEAVHEMASAISLRDQSYRDAGQPVPPGNVSAPDYQLAALHALRQAQSAVDRLAAAAARTAGHTGASYAKLGAAWGITRQSARLRWPDAVPPRGEARPVELELAGGHATITQFPDDDGYVWEATAEDGTTAQGEEPYGSTAEAAAHAGAFLQRHAHDPDAAHADCIEPHRDADGEYADCGGTPL